MTAMLLVVAIANEVTGHRSCLARQTKRNPSALPNLDQNHQSQPWGRQCVTGQAFRDPPKRARHNSPHRLVVRTSRCGRDNPGSTPGVDILAHSHLIPLGGAIAGIHWNRILKPPKQASICTSFCKFRDGGTDSCIVIWVHSSVVRAADCRSAGPWFKSGCALLRQSLKECRSNLLRQSSTHFDMRSKTSNRK